MTFRARRSEPDAVASATLRPAAAPRKVIVEPDMEPTHEEYHAAARDASMAGNAAGITLMIH